MPYCAGKKVLITGANSGIGLATAIGLAQRGAHVLIACRNPQKAAQALEQIRTSSGSNHVDCVHTDFASQASIRALAAEVLQHHSDLRVLINNHGAIFGERDLTVDGIERTFAVNHLGYFLLTSLLLPLLHSQPSARIVNVASAAHWWARPAMDNLQGERSYSEQGNYANSKMYNLMFTFALARRLQGSQVTANCLHPGVIGSDFGKNSSGPTGRLMRIGWWALKRPASGAHTSMYLADSDAVENVSGGYWHGERQRRCRAVARDTHWQEALWARSAELCGLPRV